MKNINNFHLTVLFCIAFFLLSSYFGINAILKFFGLAFFFICSMVGIYILIDLLRKE